MTKGWWRGMLLAAVLFFPGAQVTSYGQELAKPPLSTQGKQGRSSVNHPQIDSRIQITSPANGQQFEPGATLNVTVHLTSPLTANTGWVSTTIPGIGSLTGTNSTTNSYQASFVIPPTFAGPATLTPAVIDSSANPYRGASITIHVVPSTPPLSLSLIQPYTHLTSVPSTASIFVAGSYPNSLQLNLTSSVTGTTYSSSNPNVVTVDPQGNVQAVAFGTATVTVQNSGLKTFATFVVGNPARPLSPQDVTSGIKISLSGLQFDSTKNVFVQTVELTDSLQVPIAGPLYFVITDLPSGVMLWAPRSGLTQHIPPVRSPYLRLQPADGLTLRPGENITLSLQFLNRNRAEISYTPKVFTTFGMP